MKKFLAVVLLCLPVFGQAVYSGARYSSGAAISSVASSGVPTAYSARTDHCVDGSQPDCVPGATTGQAGAAIAFMGWDTDPVPFNQLDNPTTPAVMNRCFTDPDFGTYQCFVTDQSFQTATTVFSLGDSGGNRFSSDETLMTLTNTGSADLLIDVVPSRFKAHACAPSPSSAMCFVKSQIQSGTLNGNATHDSTLFDTTASVAISRTEPSTLYEANSHQKVYRLVVTQPKDADGTPTGLDTLTRTLVVDFTSDTPIPCKVLPPDYKQTWNSAGAFTFAEGGGGSYQTRDWNTGGTGLVTADTFILPVNNNPGGANGSWMYQASAGQTSGTEPNWAANCPTKGSTCTDGAVTWTNVGNISGQGPGFDVVGYNSTTGCFHLNTYTGKIFRGTGSSDPGCPAQSAVSCGSQGDALTDDWLTCDRQANVAVAGTGTRPCQMKDRFGLHAGGASGIGGTASQYATIGPTGAGGANGLFPGNGSCVDPGTHLIPANGSGRWTAGTSYTFHDFVFGSDGVWYDKKSAGTSSSTPDPVSESPRVVWETDVDLCYSYIWDVYTTMVRPLIGVSPPAGVNGGGFSTDGHNISGVLATYRGGSMFKHIYGKPTCDNNTAPCLYEGAAYPGDQMDATSSCNDSHPTWNNSGPLDLTPAFFPHADVPMWPTQYVCSSYAEETALEMALPPTQRVWRFGHNWNTGSNTGFGTEEAIGSISPQGDMLAYSSDFMNSRGDRVTGASTCAHKLRGMYAPSGGKAVTYQDTMFPSATSDNIYQAVGCPGAGGTTTCTEASSLPNWNSVCPAAGDYCTSDKTATGTIRDNNVLWLNLGPNTCRGDVAVMDVLSAHPAP